MHFTPAVQLGVFGTESEDYYVKGALDRGQIQ
jgi:hypothetical protein